MWDAVLKKCVRPGAAIGGLVDTSLFDYAKCLEGGAAGAADDLRTYLAQLEVPTAREVSVPALLKQPRNFCLRCSSLLLE